MFEESKKSTFINKIIAEINSEKKILLAVRVHESGEFYSQEYINKWVTIAKQLPNIRFYAFTKRLKDFNFTKLKALPNFVLIDSLKHKGLNYGTATDLLKLSLKGVYKSVNPPIVCPATLDKTTNCDAKCKYCWSKQAQKTGVLFIKH